MSEKFQLVLDVAQKAQVPLPGSRLGDPSYPALQTWLVWVLTPETTQLVGTALLAWSDAGAPVGGGPPDQCQASSWEGAGLGPSSRAVP